MLKLSYFWQFSKVISKFITDFNDYFGLKKQKHFLEFEIWVIGITLTTHTTPEHPSDAHFCGGVRQQENWCSRLETIKHFTSATRAMKNSSERKLQEGIDSSLSRQHSILPWRISKGSIRLVQINTTDAAFFRIFSAFKQMQVN